MSFMKGPWAIGGRWFSFSTSGHVSINATEHAALANVVWVMEDEERSPECEANAHLIAAAPEPYEAARVALTTYQGLQKAMLRTGIDVSPVIEILKETMAKARGES